MLVRDCVSSDFPFFKSTDSIYEAFAVAKKLAYSHVFVEQNGIYQYAILAESDESGTSILLENSKERQFFFVKEDDFILQCIALFSKNNCNVLPVLNHEMQLVGNVALEDVLQELGRYPFFNNEGCFLIIEKESREFSVTEVSRIIEETGAKLYGFFVSDADTYDTQAVIKISENQVNAIQQSLERYRYKMIRIFFKTNKENQQRERLNYLQFFLEL